VTLEDLFISFQVAKRHLRHQLTPSPEELPIFARGGNDVPAIANIITHWSNCLSARRDVRLK
jgi:hypothetical protein